MKKFILFLLLIYAHETYSQWVTQDIPSDGRYDDVFFINDSTGWAAGGGIPSTIYKTTNGGEKWDLKYTTSKYLRSIEFATPQLGFCGSLDSSLYKTTNGGETWVDIANSITPKPPGICGLSAPKPNVIYGCGIWSSPAYVIKSIDSGKTWTTIDLSSLADALVDIHFINADTGFVSGMANPTADGGIILYTTNGGDSWSVKHKTLVNEDYIWKLQTPDGIHFYGSIESSPVTGNVRMAKSSDSGMTWKTEIVRNNYSYIQTIGFMDTLKGWTGGNQTLFETIDGGKNWYPVAGIVEGASYNRFFKVNDTTAFLSGFRIYKYEKGASVGKNINKINNKTHSLMASPNPANKFINIDIKIENRTNCKLQLFSSTGQLIQSIYQGPIEKGRKHFSVSLEELPPQTFFLILKTNEDFIYKRITKN